MIPSAADAPRCMILPAEIRSRELDARLLQALLAVRRGWRAIVGSKAQINRGIWRFPAGVYLCQTLTERRVRMLDLLGRLGVPAVGWCEEGLVYQSRDVYLMRRVSTAVLDRLSALIAWGPSSKEDLDHKAAGATGGMEARPLGNPRIDLLRPEMRGLYEDRVSELRGRFGDFVLINTNYASANPTPAAAARRHVKRYREGSDEALASWRSFNEHREALFRAFVEMVPRLAAAHPAATFVIRPHPAEDEGAWTGIAGTRPNVTVVRDGAVVPWLLAARTVIHNGCTTAIESALLDRCPISYCPVNRDGAELDFANDAGVRTRTFGELSDAVGAALADGLELKEAQHALLDRHVGSRRGPLASERVLEVFEEASRDARPARASARAYAVARDAYKRLRVNHRTDRYVPTVFPPTDTAFIRERIAALAACLAIDTDSVSVRQAARNVFEISSSR